MWDCCYFTYLFTEDRERDRSAEIIPGSDSVERTHMVWFAMPVIVKMWSVGIAVASSDNTVLAAARRSLTLNFTSLLPLWHTNSKLTIITSKHYLTPQWRLVSTKMISKVNYSITTTKLRPYCRNKIRSSHSNSINYLHCHQTRIILSYLPGGIHICPSNYGSLGPLKTAPKQNLDWFSCFSKAHPCDQHRYHSDRHTDYVTSRHTYDSLHLALSINNNNQ